MKLLIFTCTRGQAHTEKRLSHRVARHLENMGIGEIRKVQQLGEQLSLAPGQRRKMLFLNDCNSGCVKVLTKGFHAGEFIYVDVSKEKGNNESAIEDFFNRKILPPLQEFSPELLALRSGD